MVLRKINKVDSWVYPPMKLYEFPPALSDLVEEREHTDDPELLAALDSRIVALEMGLDEKISGICAVVKNKSSDIDQVDAEIKRLKNLKTSLEGSVEWLKWYLTTILPYPSKWAQGVHRLSYRKSKALELDEEKTPLEFRSVEYPVNKEAVREALDGGAKLDFAHYVEHRNLQVK
jgi:hypothetical protein